MHELFVTLTLIAIPGRPLVAFFVFVVAIDCRLPGLGPVIHIPHTAVGVRDPALLSRAAPMLGHECPTPIVGTPWLLHSCAMHSEGNLVVGCRLLFPPRRNGNDLVVSVKIILPPVLGVIMNEYGTVPRAVKGSGPAMKTFAGFVKQEVAACKHYLVSDCKRNEEKRESSQLTSGDFQFTILQAPRKGTKQRTSLVVFNQNGPRFGIVTRINVQNEANDVCVTLIDVHM